MRRRFLIPAASMLVIWPAGAQTVPAPSIWVNERMSQLLISSVDAQGYFKGS